MTRKWNHDSHAHYPCGGCEGHGEVWNGRGRGGNDPDSWNAPCPDCRGAGHFPCHVCGFDQVIPGFDCMACETIGHLYPGDLQRFDPAAFAKAVGNAVAAARGMTP